MDKCSELATIGREHSTHPSRVARPGGDVIVIRSGSSYDGKQGMSLATGVSSRSAGAQACACTW
jgi:Predicted mannose-6-phosphate isomerase